MSSSAINDSPFVAHYSRNHTSEDILREAMRQTELFLTEQQSLAIAADRRAINLIAILIAISGYLIGDLRHDGLNAWEALTFVGLFSAIALAGLAAKPSRIYGSGSSAKNLTQYLQKEYCGYVLGGIISRNEESIKRNDRAIKRSARLVNAALIVAFGSIFVLFLDVSEAFAAIARCFGGS